MSKLHFTQITTGVYKSDKRYNHILYGLTKDGDVYQKDRFGWKKIHLSEDVADSEQNTDDEVPW